MDEPMTPVEVERHLRLLITAMTKAQRQLAACRDAEVDAKHRYEAAHRRALLSKDCPPVTRGGTTTAERDAWVSLQSAPEHRDHDLAEVRRKAAEDHLRTLNSQGVLLATLAKSVHLAYSQVGAS